MSIMMAAAAEGEEVAVEMARAAEIRLPAEVDWDSLDKWRFFVLGAALFSGVSAALYPAVVLKTRLQVCHSAPQSCVRAAAAILRYEGPRAFYRGLLPSLAGTVPARALYMGALEITKSAVASVAYRLGVPDPAAAAASCAAGGLSASVAAQFVWTPVDVISQRLMVQNTTSTTTNHPSTVFKYAGGVDAFKTILRSDGVHGLYRGFGLSILTYAPSSAVWWASYSLSQRIIWGGVSYYMSCRRGTFSEAGLGINNVNANGFRSGRANGSGNGGGILTPGYKAVVAVQGVSAAMAGGAAALVTMPLDTIKTRMQVLDGEDGRRGPMSIGRTVKNLIKEGGWRACYRGLGPRWASMSMSSLTMITTYEFLKRLSAKR